MRSRYSAFTLKDKEYLLNSWHNTTRPHTIDFDDNIKWLGLKVISTKKGLASDQEGWVNFVARYKMAGKAYRLEEHSYFSRENGNWVYVSAESFNDTQPNKS